LPATKEGIRICNKNILKEITVEVVPTKSAGESYYLVVFKETALIPIPKKTGTKSKKGTDEKQQTIRKLEEELVQSRVLIRTANEEYDTTYEELQANNEEILSSNEELQSVNEELEASKEELQSSIEELTSTNAELHTRNMELLKSQEELKKANEQLAEFAFISSHDLQEPLRKIETFSNLLSSHPDAKLNDYAKKYAGKINGSASRMSALLKALLSFSILANNDEDKFEKVDLNKILEHVLEDFEVTIAEKKATITISPLPLIYGASVKMNQLFHNLVSNALRFSTENPKIIIHSSEVTAQDYFKYPALRKETPYTAIIIQDNGIGFDDKHAQTVFRLFQRLGNSKATEGTGVGLAICKKIAEDHHGLIFATAKENEGATFTVILPTEK